MLLYIDKGQPESKLPRDMKYLLAERKRYQNKNLEVI